LSKERGEGKLEDCEMELVMMSREVEVVFSRRGFRSLIRRWWESTLTAKVVSRPVLVNWKLVLKTPALQMSKSREEQFSFTVSARW